jgi:branched-chain amino acid transport system ATP-binding protein
MLELQHISCGYGSVTAVQDLSLHVRAGSIYGILGPNGAGKSSTLLSIMGHVKQTAGRILFDGQDISRTGPQERTALGLAIAPEGRRLFTDLTVEENLIVGGYRKSRAAERRNQERVYALFPRLAERRRQVCGLMSGGEQQMLSFGRALMAEPRLLLVDELSLGLMPKAASLFVDVLRKLRGDGVTVLVVDQNTNRVLRMADEVTIMVSGQSVFCGTAAVCKADSHLFERFLGAAP